MGYKIKMETPFTALSKTLDFITKGCTEIEVIIMLDYNFMRFIIKYDSYYNIYVLYSFLDKMLFNKNETLMFLLKHDIQVIRLFKRSIKKFYYYKGVNIIQRVYRKYRIRTAKIRKLSLT